MYQKAIFLQNDKKFAMGMRKTLFLLFLLKNIKKCEIILNMLFFVSKK